MSLFELLGPFEPRQLATSQGVVQYREAAAPGPQQAVSHVLLHGIGSGSASWVHQLALAQQPSHLSNASKAATRLLAWDAPGYGASVRLPMASPSAADYAQRLWAWLDALNASEGRAPSPVTLVGHSLGCLMAASAAVQRPERMLRLVLLSPAQGYARASATDREKKLKDRLGNLDRLGPQGMADLRGAAMLSPQASAKQIAFVQSVMAQIDPLGYTQASRMLSTGDLLSDLSLLERLKCPVSVASGSADTVTPPAACQAAAAHIHAPYTSIEGAGHICALEAADAVSRLIGLRVPASKETTT